MEAYFDRFTISMTRSQAESVSHSGSADADVAELLEQPSIKRQLKKISDADLVSALRGYGAWDDDELSNRDFNEERIVWIAGGDIMDDIYEKAREREDVVTSRARKSSTKRKSGKRSSSPTSVRGIR